MLCIAELAKYNEVIRTSRGCVAHSWDYTKYSRTFISKEKTMKIKKVYLGTKQIYPERGLPWSYQEVEWIASSGWNTWPYINSWVNPRWTKFQIELDFIYSWSQKYFYGYRNSWWTSFEKFDNKVYFNAWSSINLLQDRFSLAANKEYIINALYNNWTLTVNVTWNTTYSWSTSYSWDLMNGSLPLLWNATDSLQDSKFKYFKLWTNDNLVREFIPCYRKSDNVIWMYDLVNNVFYTRSWSWTFTKWPDVN